MNTIAFCSAVSPALKLGLTVQPKISHNYLISIMMDALLHNRFRYSDITELEACGKANRKQDECSRE